MWTKVNNRELQSKHDGIGNTNTNFVEMHKRTIFVVIKETIEQIDGEEVYLFEAGMMCSASQRRVAIVHEYETKWDMKQTFPLKDKPFGMFFFHWQAASLYKT